MEFNYNIDTRMYGGFSKIRKCGAFSPFGESTPFVRDGTLMRLELIDPTRGTDPTKPAQLAICNTETGIPTLTINTEKMERIYSAARELYQMDTVHPTFDDEVDIFLKGNTHFENTTIAAYEKMRNVDFEIGILPNFKLDENREQYLAFGSGAPQVIPTTNTDTERTGMIMEALNAEGYQQVVPKYYESVIKGKYTSDYDSAEMLDIVFSNVVYDGCRMFCEDATFMLQDYVMGKGEFGSFMKSKEKRLQKQLEKNIETVSALGQ